MDLSHSFPLLQPLDYHTSSGPSSSPPSDDVIILEEDEFTANPRPIPGRPKAARKRRRTGLDTKENVPLGDVIDISSDDEPPRAAAKCPAPPDPATLVREKIQALERQIHALVTGKAAESKKVVYLQAVLEQATLSQNQLAATNAELRARLGDASKKSVDLDKFEELIYCEICSSTMWRPFILAGCGHSFCHTCLDDWFTRTLTQHLAKHPTYSINTPQQEQLQYTVPTYQQILLSYQHNLPLPVPRVQRVLVGPPPPPFTCLKCRAPVRHAPVEDFALKAMVKMVAEAMGEAEPQQRNLVTGHQLWSRYFR